MPTILVADDNSNIHKMVELALKDLGYKIEKVGNGEHAVRKLPDVKPDLILADIFMPVRNGYEVCEFVKNSEQFAHIPVVLLQGKFDPLDEHEMRRVRADGLLMKPFVPPDPLVTMVKTLLEEAASKRAAEPAPAKRTEKTVELTPAEVAVMTGTSPEPEPEMPGYAVQAPRVEISEANSPLAFGDLLEAPPAKEEKPAEPPDRDTFVASSVAAMEFEAEAEKEEAEEKAPNWGGITDEVKQPTPDEPPIKVEFSGTPEPMEIVRDEPPAPAIVEAAPLPELAATPDEWISSGPPPVAVGTESSEGWEASAPTVPVAAEAPIVASTPEPEPMAAPPPPLPYERPKLEELATPAPKADAVPAEVAAPAPAPAAEVPPPPATSFAAPPQLDAALVDAVVEKVMARLQPHVLEQFTRELVKPLTEALLRKETEK